MTPSKLILDTETTGLEPDQGHRICSIAVVALADDNHCTEVLLNTRIDPERPIEEAASAVNGLIWPDDFDGAPTFDRVLGRLLPMLSGAEIIAHNAAFDVGFLDAEIARLIPYWPGLAKQTASITCTRQLAKAKHPGISASLNNLVDFYGIDREGRGQWGGQGWQQEWEGIPHAALDDCLLLAKVYQKLISPTAPQGATHETHRPQRLYE
jgi:DNA polymerase-3 subunit epsilon